MKKILIIEDEEDLLEVMQTAVESLHPEYKVTPCLNYLTALNALTNQTFDLVISDQNLPDGTGGKIFQILQESNKKTPFVLCSTATPNEIPELKDQEIYGYLPKPMILKPLKELFQKFNKEHNFSEDNLPDYAQVKTKLLIKTQPIPCDLFIRLSEKKYVKILNKGDIFDSQDLEKYEIKKMPHLYVLRGDLDTYLDCTIKTILLALKDTTNATDVEKELKNIQLSFHALQETFNKIGITPAAKELAKTVADKSIQVVSQNKNLSLLLSKMLKSEEEYSARHSILLSAVTTAFASAMPWFSETIAIKLSVSSFLHDITLTNNDLAAIDSTNELQKNSSKFSEKEMDSFLSHTVDSASLARSIENLPPDIDNILLQHHEKPDGSGFPNQLLAQRVSPLSAIFIMAHHYVRMFIANNELTIEHFLTLEKETYAKGSFLSIHKELSSVYIEQNT